MNCDTNGYVIKITLASYNLVGTLPTELLNLPSLESLFLNDNGISGPIPIDIFNGLPNLTEVRMNQNSMTGTIPDVSSLTLVEKFWMGNNNITGTIPDSFSGMTALTDLRLNKNTLVGTIPASIASLPALTAIYLQNNYLTGSIDDGFASSALTKVNVEGNSLSSTIPSGFTLSNTARFAMNDFTGTFPTALCSATYSVDCSVTCTCCTTTACIEAPSTWPSLLPSLSSQPSVYPSGKPLPLPSGQPFIIPSRTPSLQPSTSTIPSLEPSLNPSLIHTTLPTVHPSSKPSTLPTVHPSSKPSNSPTVHPSSKPSSLPSEHPSDIPSSSPTTTPSLEPSSLPSVQPSATPSSSPTTTSSLEPSLNPSLFPTALPTVHPSSKPSSFPSVQPSDIPSSRPSLLPSSRPTTMPSLELSLNPSLIPTTLPSVRPSSKPSPLPSVQPSDIPSSRPTTTPSLEPSLNPSLTPTALPSVHPSGKPSSVPTNLLSLVNSLLLFRNVLDRALTSAEESLLESSVSSFLSTSDLSLVIASVSVSSGEVLNVGDGEYPAAALIDIQVSAYTTADNNDSVDDILHDYLVTESAISNLEALLQETDGLGSPDGSFLSRASMLLVDDGFALSSLISVDASAEAQTSTISLLFRNVLDRALTSAEESLLESSVSSFLSTSDLSLVIASVSVSSGEVLNVGDGEYPAAALIDIQVSAYTTADNNDSVDDILHDYLVTESAISNLEAFLQETDGLGSPDGSFLSRTSLTLIIDNSFELSDYASSSATDTIDMSVVAGVLAAAVSFCFYVRLFLCILCHHFLVRLPQVVWQLFLRRPTG